MGSKKRVLNAKRTKIEARKKQQQAAKDEVNPFELKINKIKHNILGRKVAKNELGKPILNRTRAVKKREKTLLKEYKNRNKVRGFQDLRNRNIGEVISSKYEAIKFNETDDIELTHKGKPLEDYIDDRLSSDDEDIDLFNRDNFIETSHFGGGRDGAPRSTKQILEDIKDEKAMKKQEKEQVSSMINKLDEEWSNIRSLVRFQSSSQPPVPDATSGKDYDALLVKLATQHEKSSPQKDSNRETKVKVVDDNLSSTNPDVVFKAKLKIIDSSDDTDEIIRHLRDILNSLLSRISDRCLELLQERLIEMSKSRLQFTLQEMSILFMSSYYNQLQVVSHMIILKALNKLRYTNYHQVATSIFFLRMLLKSNTKRFYPEMFVHLQNLLDLCMPEGPIQLKLFYRLEHKANVILSAAKFKDNLVQDVGMNVTLTNLFEGAFSDDDNVNIAYNLAVQVVGLAANVYDHLCDTPVAKVLIRPVTEKIKTLSQCPLPPEMKIKCEAFLIKTNQIESIVIVNETKPKPFSLNMLEPRIEENFTGKNRVDEKKKLARRYKQEFKGAQREIRKDSIFLRNTFLKDIQRKDRQRKQKVKELLRDLSVQQGLYKKKK